MKVKAVWQFFETEAAGEALHLFCSGRKGAVAHLEFQAAENWRPAVLERLHFAGQRWKAGPRAVFVVTAVKACVNGRKRRRFGLLLPFPRAAVLAIETAEACAEWLHRRIREDWGFPDSAEMTMAQRFTSRYRGKRYSFGYPACPDLEDQAGL